MSESDVKIISNNDGKLTLRTSIPVGETFAQSEEFIHQALENMRMIMIKENKKYLDTIEKTETNT